MILDHVKMSKMEGNPLTQFLYVSCIFLSRHDHGFAKAESSSDSLFLFNKTPNKV